mgnify:CR=1 FL=1
MWFNSWIKQVQDEEIIVQSVALLWAIWLQRNSYVFNHNRMSIADTIEAANVCFSAAMQCIKLRPIAYYFNIAKELDAQANECVLQEVVDQDGGLRQWIFVIDGSWRNSGRQATDVAGVAWICFDAHNQLVAQEALVLQLTLSPLMAEAKACLEAIRCAARRKLRKLIKKTNCQVLVRLLQQKWMEMELQVASIINYILYYNNDRALELSLEFQN